MTWNGVERRDKSLIKDQIFREIQESEDKNLKAILALMYGSLEYTDDAIQRIEAKIDSIKHDDVSLKKLVLNGYNDKHQTHHEWLDGRISNDDNIKSLISRAMPIIEWAEKFKEEEKSMRQVCAWSKATMLEDIELKKDKKTLVMRFLGGVFNQIGAVVATALVAWIMWGPK